VNEANVVDLDFLTSVAIAGLAFVAGTAIVHRVELLRRWFIPVPVIGGLLAAALLAAPAAFDVRVEVPDSGRPVQFLAALLTTNMGLHITTKVLKHGWRLFLLFVAFGAVLFVAQLLVVLPVAAFTPDLLRYALLIGPLAFVGVPFPPEQTQPIADLLATGVPNFETVSRAARMVGILVAAFLPGLFATWMFRRAGEQPPRPSPSSREATIRVWSFANAEAALLALIFAIIAVSFPLQDLLLRTFPALRPSFIPILVLTYLLGAVFRLAYDALPLPPFPQKPLTVLLLGPTMGFVLTYIAMTLPTHYLADVTVPILVGALLTVAVTAGVAWLAYSVFRRFTHRYFAAVICVTLLAVTAGIGPIAMSYLRSPTRRVPSRPCP
jgi:ESS family glutamate:Na+ symporter